MDEKTNGVTVGKAREGDRGSAKGMQGLAKQC